VVRAAGKALEPPDSPQERAARGKAARATVPRSSHGEWQPAADRIDPVKILRQGDTGRVPELVPLRYERMLVSPFTFYRGTAAIMAADLAGSPNSGLRAQLCGDAHLSNFGLYAAPDRQLVFDLNDFDETFPGPWEWDVKRLAASLEIAGRDRGFADAERYAAVAGGVASYRETMRNLAKSSNLDVWYTRFNVDGLRELMATVTTTKRGRKEFNRTVARAEAKTRERALAKLTESVNGGIRFKSDPPYLERLEDIWQPEHGSSVAPGEVLAPYRRSLPPDRRHLLEAYRPVDIARKVVGVGSVGTRCWIVLFLGRDHSDPLFLQFKEAQPSVLEAHLPGTRERHHGRRVVVGQQLLQAASDILLGWLTVTGIDGRNRNFYGRQLWDEKGSAEVSRLDPRMLTAYARLCGGVLARAHARSGDRIAIGSYLGSGDTFDRAIAAFASAYADQNQRDFERVRAAVS
jgi:uncharacterized protein (DUF2252 family)